MSSRLDELRRRAAADPWDREAARQLEYLEKRTNAVPLTDSWPTIKKAGRARHIVVGRREPAGDDRDRRPIAITACSRHLRISDHDQVKERDSRGFRDEGEGHGHGDCPSCQISATASFIAGREVRRDANVSMELLKRYGVVHYRRGFTRRLNATQMAAREEGRR